MRQRRRLTLDECRIGQQRRRVDLEVVSDVEIVKRQPAGEALWRDVDVEIAERSRVREEPRRRGDYAKERERGQQFDVL